MKKSTYTLHLRIYWALLVPDILFNIYVNVAHRHDLVLWATWPSVLLSAYFFVIFVVKKRP